MNRLKNYILITISIVVLTACGSNNSADTTKYRPSDGRYSKAVFNEVAINFSVPYGEAVTQGGRTKTLVLDFYEPKNDVESARPLILLAFGGGFRGGNKLTMGSIAYYFAKSGYAVASIDYRVLDVPRDEQTLPRAVMDAVHDMKAAVRFLKANASVYKIDTNNIFIGGASAGAVTALNYAYLNRDSEVVEAGGNALLSYINARGGLEGNSGNGGTSSAIKGVINMAGGLVKASAIDSGEPMLHSTHGTADETVPFYEGLADNSSLFLQGSGLLHIEAQKEGIVHRLNAIEGAGHNGIYSTSSFEKIRAFIYENLI